MNVLLAVGPPSAVVSLGRELASDGVSELTYWRVQNLIELFRIQLRR